VRVALAGVVLMIGLAVCVLMAAITASHQERDWVVGQPVAAAARP
jgi:hypothetical protein